MAFANIVPGAQADGLAYATNVPLTPTEADIGDGLICPHPIPTEFGQAIVAVVQLTVNGYLIGNLAYVAMQMDFGDGVWADLNWAITTINQGRATFVFSNGIAGANTFQQTRNIGSAPTPQANGANQMCLGGRIRFTGQAQLTGGSSSTLSPAAGVTATIKYKLLGLR